MNLPKFSTIKFKYHFKRSQHHRHGKPPPMNGVLRKNEMEKPSLCISDETYQPPDVSKNKNKKHLNGTDILADITNRQQKDQIKRGLKFNVDQGGGFQEDLIDQNDAVLALENLSISPILPCITEQLDVIDMLKSNTYFTNSVEMNLPISTSLSSNPLESHQICSGESFLDPIDVLNSRESSINEIDLNLGNIHLLSGDEANLSEPPPFDTSTHESICYNKKDEMMIKLHDDTSVKLKTTERQESLECSPFLTVSVLNKMKKKGSPSIWIKNNKSKRKQIQDEDELSLSEKKPFQPS